MIKAMDSHQARHDLERSRQWQNNQGNEDPM